MGTSPPSGHAAEVTEKTRRGGAAPRPRPGGVCALPTAANNRAIVGIIIRCTFMFMSPRAVSLDTVAYLFTIQPSGKSRANFYELNASGDVHAAPVALLYPGFTEETRIYAPIDRLSRSIRAGRCRRHAVAPSKTHSKQDPYCLRLRWRLVECPPRRRRRRPAYQRNWN